MSMPKTTYCLHKTEYSTPPRARTQADVTWFCEENEKAKIWLNIFILLTGGRSKPFWVVENRKIFQFQ